MNWKIFLQSVFCEPTADGQAGKPSFSRLAAGLSLAFILGWGTALVRHTHAMPDLGGSCMLLGTIYGLNQGGRAAKAWLDGKAGKPDAAA